MITAIYSSNKEKNARECIRHECCADLVKILIPLHRSMSGDDFGKIVRYKNIYFSNLWNRSKVKTPQLRNMCFDNLVNISIKLFIDKKINGEKLKEICELKNEYYRNL